MKFVHFWDDNIVAPVVVVATTAVATVGTMFLGIGHPPEAAYAPAPITLPTSIQAPAMMLDQLGYEGSAELTSEDLCERVITKEDDIDHMNAEIDKLMEKVKQRSRKGIGSTGVSTKPPR